MYCGLMAWQLQSQSYSDSNILKGDQKHFLMLACSQAIAYVEPTRVHSIGLLHCCSSQASFVYCNSWSAFCNVCSEMEEEGGQIPNTILSALLQILLIHFKLLLSISTLYQHLLQLTSPIIKLMYMIKGRGGGLAWLQGISVHTCCSKQESSCSK